MAKAFRGGVEAGRTAFEAGLMEARELSLPPSTPVVGTTVLACRILIATRILIASIPSSTGVAWVARLALLGVGTIQLRAKNLSESDALQTIMDALEVIRGHDGQTRGERLLARGDHSPKPSTCISGKRTSREPI